MISTSYQELYLFFWIIHDHVLSSHKPHSKSSCLFRFMECKDQTKHSSVMLPYTFLPTMATRKPRDAANKVYC
ncbi:calcium ion binding [Zea mays]|uniref:Calcium ion binding n=1 Tax=Zea mays TaxID=4577 RepID=A0A1D6QRS5_MAIZE|nr:calcium ion binding [Zea mays]